MQPLVAAARPVVGGLVVVKGVGAAVPAAGSTERARAAAAGVRWRPPRPGAAGLLLPSAAGLLAGVAGFLLGPPAGLLLLAALPCAVGGLLAGGRAEPPLAAGIVGLLEPRPAVGAGSTDHADGGHHRLVTPWRRSRSSS
jgi:hypothetical protein